MQEVELVLDHHDFFCPVTGQKIIGEDGEFNPSPAMVYCFVDPTEPMEYAKENVQELYNKFLKETDDDYYESYKKLVKEMNTQKTENYVVFSIQGNSPFASFGPSKFCIDMNYQVK